MACASVDMDIHGADEESHEASRRELLGIQHYKASEIVSDDKGPLHDLLQKQPAVLGSLQMVSGLLSVGLGVIFAVTQEMKQSFFTLFRVSLLTGMLFIIAGGLSNLLFKYPGLLPVSLMVNCGCIIVAVFKACLISVDLSYWNPQDGQYLRIELLELCVLGLQMILSAILCVWISEEKRSKSL